MPAPLLIFGLDAGDPRLLERWASEGRLPNVRSVMQRGCWARTAGAELINEHGVWVTLLTGRSSARHGFYNFRQLVPGAYDLEPKSGRDLGIPPFWTRLRGQDRKVVVVDAPDTLPVPGLAGVQLCDWATHQPLGPPAAEPASLLERVRAGFGTPLRLDEIVRASRRQALWMRERLLERIELRGRLCRELLGEGDFAFGFIGFSELHPASHQFWDYRPEAAGAAPDGPLCHAIRDVYQAVDAEIGRLLEVAPRDANVAILSSVGVRDHHPMQGILDDFCVKLGYRAVRDRTPAGVTPIAWFRTLVPASIRPVFKRWLSPERRTRMVASWFRNATRWSETTVFPIPAFYTGNLRVNLIGREPQGTVAPGAAYAALLARLEDDLRQIVDPATHEPLVARLVRAAELTGSEEPPETLPDLFVLWRSRADFVERAVHPRAALTQSEPEFLRSSDHDVHGFLALAGPSVRRTGRVPDVAALDVAPTLAELVSGTAVDLDGRPRSDLLARRSLPSPAPRRPAAAPQ